MALLSGSGARLDAQLVVEVREADSEEPVVGASVRMTPTGSRRSTDEQGNAWFRRLHPGSYRFEVSHWAYEPTRIDVGYEGGGVLRFPVPLRVRPQAVFEEGTPLRVYAPAVTADTLVGEAMGMRGDTLLLRPARNAPPLRIHATSIKAVQIRHETSEPFRGIAWGGIVGGVLGTGLGPLLNVCIPGRSCVGTAEAALGAIGGVALGTALGGILGSLYLRTGEWVPLPWPPRRAGGDL